MKLRLGLLIACLALVPLAVGCGSDDESGGSGAGTSAVELTKRLPPEQLSYVVLDLDGMREEGLIDEDYSFTGGLEDAEPFTQFVLGTAIAGISALPPPEGTIEALQLQSASGIAAARGDGAGVTAIATSADVDEVRSGLEDVDYAEEDGVMVSSVEAAPRFVLEDGLIIAADTDESLRSIPDEPADEFPEPLLERADGLYADSLTYGTDCLGATSTVLNGDGTGTLAYRINGEPDPKNLVYEDTDNVKFEDPVVDGDVISVDATGEPDALAIRNAVQQFFFSYDCG